MAILQISWYIQSAILIEYRMGFLLLHVTGHMHNCTDPFILQTWMKIKVEIELQININPAIPQDYENRPK
jgi:hypothetical protein